MAPALTEPLSPTENLTSSAVTAPNTPVTRSNRKLDSTIANKSKGITKNISVKSAQSIRGKRHRSSYIINQTPTSSKRVARFRDSLQRNSLTPSTPINEDNISETKKNITTRSISKAESGKEFVSSVSSNTNNNSIDSNNEQMGLSTDPLIDKNKILNTITNKNNTSENLDTINENTKDTSTAQLLADLTNEAITAEICLRNQLKDVNLVKSSGDPSSPIIQQETFVDTHSDIVVLKVASPTIAIAPESNITTTAHMEAQFSDSKSSSFLDTIQRKELEDTSSTRNPVKDLVVTKEIKYSSIGEESGVEQKEELVEVAAADKCPYTENEDKKEKSTVATEISMESTTVGSPHSSDYATEAKKTVSKHETLSLQELPPVSTDSTMTASEVEDNLEERLSQLDGTAIDSPPPNNHDIDSKEKNSQSSVSEVARPHTPTNQQTLCNELQELQQQLQQMPPIPVAQQVQSNNLQQSQQPQQTNCFSNAQSTTSSINLLGNVSSNMSQSYIKESDNVGGATELEDHDIDEVIKVLKGFEGGTTSDLNVCDLNVLFNEVYMKINETEITGNAGSGGSLAIEGRISSNTPSHVSVTNPSIQLVKPTEMEEGQLEIEKRQQQMQKKIDFLMRRLRKLQARYMCKHTSEEIAGLFEWSARQTCKGVLNTTCLQHNESTGTQDASRCFLKVIAARPPSSDWKDVHESLLPASQITTLLRKIQSVANAQQLCTTTSASLVNITTKKTKKALMEAQAVAAATNSSTIGSSIFNDGKADEVVVSTLDENITDELSQVAGLLQIEMTEVQKAIDSDATESSSGGESADEMVTYNNTQQHTLPITKRAAWRYSRDRAAIASRWSWLLSQISDLEIKIRQHSELHQEILRSKGVVTCGNQNNTTEENADEEIMSSCRTRGYMPSLFRKRKLIQTTNIHTISKKAARPSTIKCGCQWPLHPCALCTGRLDPTAPRDLPDTMMMSDRIALLDSGYHPVLSFRENVNNALHFEAVAKLPEWQQRVMRCQAKNIAKNVWKAEREAVAAAGGGHHTSSSKKYSETPPAKRRYIKKKDKLNSDEKTGGKSSNSARGTQQQNNAVTAKSVSAVTSNATLLTAAASTIDIGNEGLTIVKEEILKNPSNSLPPPKCLSTTSLTSTTHSSATTTKTTSNKKYIHQTSDCLPTNYDQFNHNQTHLSLISNNHNQNSSKSNKHRKLSSSAVVHSHHYNHPNNSSTNLYNGDSSHMFSNEYWGGAGENFNVRSRTSSPTHGSSSNIYHKYERSLDRKNRASYDIDNIVIPYSVAAATRVEVLPYKEIPTPKWRVIDIENVEDNVNEIEILLDAKLVTNGHVCDNKLEESIKKQQTDFEMKSEEFSTSIKNEVDVSKEQNSKLNNSKESDIVKIEKQIEVELKTLKVDTKENGYCLTTDSSENSNIGHIEEEYNKSQSNSDNNKNDETTKKPELKKFKINAGVVDVRNYDSKNKKEEHNEEKLALQNGLEICIEEDEDISDDALFLKHERALSEERRKFQTYLKFPWSTRSRANRRIDSRAESSGANTPDPSSPAPQTPSVGGGDLESIPSPLNPATPLNPLDTISEAGDNSTSFLGINSLPSLSSKRYERRRTTSSKRDREVERRSSTPDSKELIPPYEPLTFPLTEEQFEELLSAMPSEHGEDCKRFDECYLPGGSGGLVGLGGIPSNKFQRTVSSSNSKRSSRASTLCGDAIATTSSGSGVIAGRRTKSSISKNLRPISADDSNAEDILLYDDDYEDDYPRHHLAASDDHLTADSVGFGNFTACDGLYDDDDDVYADQYSAYVGKQQRKDRTDIEEDSSEEEPFQDDDPNDPEWRGETEERFRKKV